MSLGSSDKFQGEIIDKRTKAYRDSMKTDNRSTTSVEGDDLPAADFEMMVATEWARASALDVPYGTLEVNEAVFNKFRPMGHNADYYIHRNVRIYLSGTKEKIEQREKKTHFDLA